MSNSSSNPLSRTDSPAQPSSTRSSTPRNNATTAGTTKQEVRILMLHGYTQSGPLFRAKTRALEKLLAKALAPAGLVPTLLYPTAPNRLSVRDIPGYEPRRSGSSIEEGGDAAEEVDYGLGQAEEEKEEIDSWAWFRRDEATGSYRFVREGMGRLAEVINASSSSASCPSGKGDEQSEEAGAGEKEQQPGFIDGVIGFSQGGCMAGMLASALEEGRTGQDLPMEHTGWVGAVREANGGRPLKFAVVYSGFYAVPGDLAWLYEPKIKTPTLHFLGSLDTVVDESRSRGLVERCEAPVVFTHPGGHYVPVSKEWVMPLAGFIKKCLDGEGQGMKL
ncbi:hypothetical protein N657DRAFT_712068 [Parathielavia appendiculata]|uniref:Serine hydrolase domain-containing protein n=1 Tax=Parathielavia appendiculata TaxID=2587402 RepID=A0AAN6U1N4_9PEZI|nr:hypothetical protein N657DRAFT_712068 [Parathielavia appendiculata]